MQDTEMMNLWKLYDRKLEENLSLNRQNAADITRLKVQSFVSSMTPWKIFTVILGVLWVGFIDVLIIGLFSIASPFFLVSAAVIALLNKLAIGIYLYQLILIHQVDVNEPILATQEKIARLKSSTLWIARLLFLQLPFWTTFYLTVATFKNGNIALLLLQVLITLAFTFLAVWLFRNIRYANRNKKWFRLIFSGREWDPVLKSMDLLGQVQEYER